MTDKDLGALPAQNVRSAPTEGHETLVLALLEALKEAREWVESTALACGYVGCTTEDCASRRAEASLAIIDAAICKATTASSVGTDERSEEVNQNNQVIP